MSSEGEDIQQPEVEDVEEEVEAGLMGSDDVRSGDDAMESGMEPEPEEEPEEEEEIGPLVVSEKHENFSLDKI